MGSSQLGWGKYNCDSCDWKTPSFEVSVGHTLDLQNLWRSLTCLLCSHMLNYIFSGEQKQRVTSCLVSWFYDPGFTLPEVVPTSLEMIYVHCTHLAAQLVCLSCGLLNSEVTKVWWVPCMGIYCDIGPMNLHCYHALDSVLKPPVPWYL